MSELRRTKFIRRDGQSYTFTPGEFGSTVAHKKMPRADPFKIPMATHAKIVPSPLVTKKKKPKEDGAKFALKTVEGRLLFDR